MKTKIVIIIQIYDCQYITSNFYYSQFVFINNQKKLNGTLSPFITATIFTFR